MVRQSVRFNQHNRQGENCSVYGHHLVAFALTALISVALLDAAGFMYLFMDMSLLFLKVCSHFSL